MLNAARHNTSKRRRSTRLKSRLVAPRCAPSCLRICRSRKASAAPWSCARSSVRRSGFGKRLCGPLAAAREVAYRASHREGLFGQPRGRVYASDQAHSSVEKAVLTLGFGQEGYRRVESDHAFRMRPDALRDAIAEDVAAGVRPVAVVATLGTTSSASLDPVAEIAEIAGWHKLARNLTLAGLIAVVVPLAMALIPGGGDAGYTFGVLWRLFGTTNQLTAGLALTVIAVWVLRMKRNPIPAVVPLVFLLAMTTWALFSQFWDFVQAETWSERWVLAPLDAIIFVLAIWLIVEAVMALRGGAGRRTYDEMGSPVGDDTRTPTS